MKSNRRKQIVKISREDIELFTRPCCKMAVTVKLMDGFSDAVAAGYVVPQSANILTGTVVIKVLDQYLLDEDDDGHRQVFFNEVKDIYPVYWN